MVGTLFRLLSLVEYIQLYGISRDGKPNWVLYGTYGTYKVFFSSEGALYVILPYDYQAAARPLFEHTPVLNDNFEY